MRTLEGEDSSPVFVLAQPQAWPSWHLGSPGSNRLAQGGTQHPTKGSLCWFLLPMSSGAPKNTPRLNACLGGLTELRKAVILVVMVVMVNYSERCVRRAGPGETGSELPGPPPVETCGQHSVSQQ